MEEKQMIENNSFLLKIKQKIYQLFHKTKKQEENNTKKQPENKYSKERMMKLYKDLKNRKVDVHSLDDKELEILTKLIKEEVILLRKKLETENAETKMYESQIRYYEKKIKEKNG